jgi:exodeoxyribonuclease V beta subunit
MTRPKVIDQLELAGHSVIEASAGTGKTYTLEHLVVELVKRGAAIEEILVVTFTEKATREMRVRIRSRLREESSDPRVATQLAAFDRAPISTIHGFCQRLLAEHAFASGRFFEQERVDARAAFGSALRDVMRSAEGDVQAVLSIGLEQFGQLELEECLARFHRETCAIEPAVDLGTVRDALLAIPESVDLEAALLLITHTVSRRRPREQLPILFDFAARAKAGEPIEKLLPELLAWATASEGRKSVQERTIVDLGRHLGAHETLGAPLRALARVVCSPVPLLVRVVLPAVRERLLRDKHEKGLFDFDDLLTVVVETLRSPRGPELVRAVQQRHRHALVDEFQDTDERQWEIFRRLFFDAGPIATTLTVIGDPKQAIYGFRGADVHTYEIARKEIEANGRRAVLDESFRTSPALVAAVHRVLVPQEGEAPFFTGINRYDAPVRAARTALGLVDREGRAIPPLRLVHLTSQSELRAKSVRTALAEHYAQQIADLVAGDARVVDENGAREIRAADVMVLTRSSAEGDEIGEALRARGIPYAFFRKDGLFATDEAKDVLDVLTALVTPRDRALRTRALVSPLFAVPVTQLRAARELPSDHPTLRTFERLVELSQQRELAPLFRALEGETGLSRRELYLFESERRLTNYLHLFEVLLALSHRGRLSLRDLVERLSELTSGRARPSEDQDIQRLPSERSAVQILTVHKSKGLEAEALFAFGGFGQKPASERGPVALHPVAADGSTRRVAWAGPLGPDQRALANRADDEEAQRLYYVALTRARSLLTLPYVGPRPLGARTDVTHSELPMRGAYRVVNARLRAVVMAPQEGDERLITRTELEVESTRRKRTKTTPMPPRDGAALERALAPLPELREGTVKALRSSLAGPEVTSYSRMKSRKAALASSLGPLEESERAREEGVDAVDVVTPESDALPGGTSIGVMVHEILEHLPIERVRGEDVTALAVDPEMLAIARIAAERNTVDPSLAPAALALALRAQRTPVHGAGLTLAGGFAEPVRRLVEMPFVHPIPETSTLLDSSRDDLSSELSIERGYVRGVIDLLFEHDGRLFVLDWKTDRLARYDARSLTEHVEAHYEVQARLYTLACVRLFGLDDEGAFERRFGGLVYAFLRGMSPSGDAGVSFRRPSLADVRAWERALAETDAPWGYPLPPRRSLTDLASRVEAPEMIGPLRGHSGREPEMIGRAR